MSKYEILLKILDQIRSEAPPEYKSYHKTKNIEELNQARSKAFIHLFLKVKCGLTSFKDRHNLICDKCGDGGLDAFYIDTEHKRLFLIQSKFRTKEDNFISKSLTADDLIKIEVNRILKGETQDSKGNDFNSKVKQFQSVWSQMGDQAKYNYKVVFLGNLKNYSDNQIRRLIDFSNYEIFDFTRTYNELVYPLCSGTYYDPKEITIKINLYKKQQSTLKQTITTKNGDYDVIVIYVPTEEVGGVMLKYKNSLLRYNPRNYLTISRNKVNKSIRDSIVITDTNDFALFNNGITILADDCEVSDYTGKKFEGQLIMTNPQIINGGQTAYTLSKIYEQNVQSEKNVFDGKEVLFKIIILKEDEEDPNLDFIETISNATNKQTSVDEADRRSNDSMQIKIQKMIYQEFGYFYERKRGEFYNGEENKYLDPYLIINRYDFLRAYYALRGNPRWARQRGKEILFRLDTFKQILDTPSNYKKMFFAWLILDLLFELDYCVSKNDWVDYEDFKDIKYGQSLRYGKMAVIAAIGLKELDKSKLTKEDIEEYVEEKVKKVLIKWEDFEKEIRTKPKNKDYFEDEPDFDNYYKGKTIDEDVKKFFSKK
ncbi:AIPR family protein [Candidatus Woesearchaeota archaeon]|nr:AIPR family protein [Candidatus Woesearchaeota archaeon]